VTEDRVEQRLSDITEAISAIRSHLERGDISDGLVFDAVRIRLLEIGEAVKSLPPDVISAESDIPWSQIARMRDHLAHRCFDTSHAIVGPPSSTTCRRWRPPSNACATATPDGPRRRPIERFRATSRASRGEQCSPKSCGLGAD